MYATFMPFHRWSLYIYKALIQDLILLIWANFMNNCVFTNKIFYKFYLELRFKNQLKNKLMTQEDVAL
jgi:hypothetical protein